MKGLKPLAALALMDLALQSSHGQKPCSMVSGPISTGGLGSVEENLRAFTIVIEELRKQGHPEIFSQIVYEEQILELYHEWHKEHGKDLYFQPLLDEFYKPLLESKMIGELWFIPGWRSSKGAVWEHNLCTKLHIRVRMIQPEDFQHWLRMHAE